MVNAVDAHCIDVRDNIGARDPPLDVRVFHERVKEVRGRNAVDVRVMFHFGDAAIGSLLGDGAISDILKVLEKRRLRHLATSALQVSVAKQIEVQR